MLTLAPGGPINHRALLELKNIGKKYNGYPAVKNVNLRIYPGEIHGLVGENGSGKSTLLGIIAGNTDIARTGGYEGQVELNGRKIDVRSPAQALALGIGMVNQEFALIPSLEVAQNIFLGRENIIPWTRRLFGSKLAYVDYEQDIRDSRQMLSRLGCNIDPKLKTADLSINCQQLTELARVIGKPAMKLLVMDEPTAALARGEVDRLFAVLRDIALSGTGIIFVSHRLEEVLKLCDRATVLRDGQVAEVFSRDEFDLRKLAVSMLGRDAVHTYRTAGKAAGEKILELRNFNVDMPGEELRGVSLAVRQGEIVGLISMPGHGKMAVGNGIMGVYPSGGEVKLAGEKIQLRKGDEPNTSRLLAFGLYLLPDDRMRQGLLLSRSVAENITFSAVQQGRFLWRFGGRSTGFVSKRQSSDYAKKIVAKLDIRCNSVNQKVSELSGGNQQKVCIGRAMAMSPKVLFVHEPTRGVDVGAKEMLLNALLTINKELGTALVIASSELDDLKRICERLIVFYEGEIVAELAPDSSQEQLALAMAGNIGKGYEN